MSAALRLFDGHRIVENREAVIRAAALPSSEPGADAKVAFVLAVNRLCGTSVNAAAGRIEITFDHPALVAELVKARALPAEKVARGEHLVPARDRERARERIADGFELYRRVCPELTAVTDAIIGEVLCVHSRPGMGGGTVSSHPGLIWLAPNEHWTAHDFALTLAHETVHAIVFLEDMVRCIFPDPHRMSDEAAQVRSAILRIRRPLDKSFHSACVAVGQMYYCHQLGRDDLADTYLRPLRATTAELTTKAPYMTRNGCEIVDELGAFAAEANYQMIQDSLLTVDLLQPTPV